MRDWLKSLREAKGYTMKEAGAKLGVSESYYCAIENGTRKKDMSLGLASGLASMFGVSVEEIVRLETAGKASATPAAS